jgi:hypothetical protein
MGFTLEHIHRTTKRLGRLLPAKPSRDSNVEYSLKDGIFLMAPKLLEMKQMGFSTAELSAALESEGIAIKGQTLNRYLFEYQSAQERESAPIATAAPTAQEPESAPVPPTSYPAASAEDTPQKHESAQPRKHETAETATVSGESVSAVGLISGKNESAQKPDSAESESAKSTQAKQEERYARARTA